jgi:hypothetical protein
MIVSFNEMLLYLLFCQSCFGNCNTADPTISLHFLNIGMVLFMLITADQKIEFKYFCQIWILLGLKGTFTGFFFNFERESLLSCPSSNFPRD